MSEAPDVETAWEWLLERRPSTRGWFDDTLPPIAAAAYAEPVLRGLFPFHTHGTLKFVRNSPPWHEPPVDDLPFIVLGDPPYDVYTSGYRTRLGEATTAVDAVNLVVAHLPPDLNRTRPAPLVGGVTVTVRRAVVADAGELARLRHLSLTCPSMPWTEPRAVPGGPWVKQCEEAIATLLRDQDRAAAFVVDAGDGVGRLAACAMGILLPRLPGPDSGEPFNGDISTVATDPEFRRRGYARATVTALMDWMAGSGCKRISLASSPEGEPLYTSLGFTHDAPRMSWRVR